MPNLKCKIYPYIDIDVQGESLYDTVRSEGCSVVTFRLENLPTPVRADTSASQGRVTMQRAMIRVLLSPKTSANFGAKVVINAQPGLSYKVVEMQPRFDAVGKLDHYQCDLERL